MTAPPGALATITVQAYMPLYQVLVLAIIQGLTEFIPVSSSGHLALAPWLLGWKDPGLAFDVALHVGTLVAVLMYFLRDWLQIIAEGFGLRFGTDPQLVRNPRLLWLLVLGTIPAGIAGLAFEKYAESNWRSPYIIGTMMVVVGVVMWIADNFAALRKDIGQVNGGDALTIGLAQALAIVPGTSRSGITMIAGLFRGLDRPAAARFSFLLLTPITAAAALKKLWDVHKEGGIPPDMRTPFILGIVVSAIVGALVIRFLLRYLRRHTLITFVYYRLVFGLIIIALAMLHFHGA